MKPEIEYNKIVVFTGAGISAESGIPTFRDSDGLWEKHKVENVASPEGWNTNPELVLDFYNERRNAVAKAKPNDAHYALAKLESKYNVIIVTQNIDDLHERAGSSTVIHVHGQIKQAKSTVDSSLIYDIGNEPIQIGDVCEKGSQLRPNIVWFGEDIENYEISKNHLANAGKVLVVGTSLTVFPAAGMLKKARNRAEKIIVSYDIKKKPYGFNWLRGKATSLVPSIVEHWINGRKVI